MRHIYILLFILGTVTTTLAQTNKPAPVITRYYCFTGTIDKYPVTFHLYRINDKFSGSYYYNSTEENIDVNGEMDKNRFLKLSHSNNEGEEQETLSGNFKDSGFSGTWSSKGKLLPFRISQKKENSGLTFDYIYTHGEKKLPKKDDNYRTELSFDAATIWPAASCTHPAVNLVKQIIYEEFNDKQGKDDIGKVMLREKSEILNPAKDDEGIMYALEKRIKIEYQNYQLLTLSKFTYYDMGGAHGNYGTFYACIDLVHNRELSINDVLDSAACHNQLQTLLEKKFRTAYNVKKEEKLSEYLFNDTISLTNNISLTSKGIRFNYNPYEIGSYAMGEIQLFIPYKELNSYLRPEFKKLIGW
jgi:hypothetical protein